jgi:hypothetical protein
MRSACIFCGCRLRTTASASLLLLLEVEEEREICDREDILCCVICHIVALLSLDVLYLETCRHKSHRICNSQMHLRWSVPHRMRKITRARTASRMIVCGMICTCLGIGDFFRTLTPKPLNTNTSRRRRSCFRQVCALLADGRTFGKEIAEGGLLNRLVQD